MEIQKCTNNQDESLEDEQFLLDKSGFIFCLQPLLIYKQECQISIRSDLNSLHLINTNAISRP